MKYNPRNREATVTHIDCGMSVSTKHNWLNVVRLNRLVTDVHTMLPYRFARNGYAFPPWHYYFEVTRRCNLRCRMCQYIHWLSNTPVAEQQKDELSTDEWKGLVDQVNRFSLITFTGGEPFVRDDFDDILEYAGVRTRTHVITNGTLLNEDRVRRIVAMAPKRLGLAGLNFVGVSIDGPQEVHDYIRKMPEGFARSTSGIKAIVDTRKRAGKACPIIHVTSVIQKDNVDHLAEMPEVVARMGADVLNLTIEVRNQELDGLGEKDPAGFRLSDIAFPRIEPDRLAQALRETRAAAERHEIELRTPSMPDEEIVRYYQGQVDLSRFRCGSIWSAFFVGCKGNAYPCWLKRIGDARTQSLKEIWKSAEFRAFRGRIRRGLCAPCAGCCFIVHKG